jgi:hypothetical protein
MRQNLSTSLKLLKKLFDIKSMPHAIQSKYKPLNHGMFIMKKILTILVCTILCNAFALEAADLSTSRCATCGGTNKTNTNSPKKIAVKKTGKNRNHHHRRHHHKKRLNIPYITYDRDANTVNYGPGRRG